MEDRVRKILVDYYSEAKNAAVIPQSLMPKIIEKLVCGGIKKIIQFVGVDNMYESSVYDCLYRYAQTCEIKRFYAVNFLKQYKDKRCDKLLARDKKHGIDSSVCVLSKASSEELPEFNEFILFDDNIAIVNRTIYATENILTEDKRLIDNCKKWLAIGLEQRQKNIGADFLQEPLMQSADMLYEVASLCCTHNHVNADSCKWYHSVWQYLRLLDMVSTPSWHNEFYLNKLFDNTESGGKSSVLISGTADYSILSYILHVADKKNIDADVSVIDLCETPLFACRWYANKVGHTVNAKQVSIFDVDESKKYNMISADAFLTRFKGELLDKVLTKWYDLLDTNGIVVTTVRVHDEKHICPSVPTKEAVQKFKEKARARMEVWERYINLTADEMADAAEYYAKNMVSNNLGTKEHITNAIEKNGFTIEYLDDVEVSGELYPSRYLRLVFKKK